MKTEQQINAARLKLRVRVLTPGLTDVQKAMVMGMLNALVWAADGENASTIERMLGDEPLDAGKDHAPAMDHFKAAVSSFRCPKCGQVMAHSRLHGMVCMTCR